MMLPIHLAIGVIEGLISAGVILFVYKTQPEILELTVSRRRHTGVKMRPVLGGLLAAALLSGAGFAWFAAAGLHESLAAVQERLSFMPDYGFRPSGEGAEEHAEAAWPAVDAETSTAGIVGVGITLAFAAGVGILLRRRAGSPNGPLR